jgi:hypothetical protein
MVLNDPESLMLIVLGPILTKGPYLLCNSISLSGKFPEDCIEALQKLVKEAINGPGMWHNL